MAAEIDDVHKVAMDFAHEVLGWNEATFDSYGPPRGIWRENYAEDAEQRPEYLGFRFGQIDDAFPMVRRWCMQHWGYGVRLHFTCRGTYIATVQDETVWPFAITGESEECEDASHALMIACLQADRKLRVSMLT